MLSEYVEQLKHQYPHPTIFDEVKEVDDFSYCVGGALLMDYAQYSERDYYVKRFPSDHELARVLLRINDNLDIQNAYYFAEGIIRHNDNADYEAAWALLDDALTFAGESNES